MPKRPVGVLGATGFAGRELLAILAKHPGLELAFAASESYAGKRFSEVYPDPLDVILVSPQEAAVADAELVFLCTPHGASAGWAIRALAAGCRVVDLSADFRLRDVATYERWYVPHPAPELLDEAVYGLTELERQALPSARLVANPGCYPTSVLFPLQPLVRVGALADGRIIVDSKSGTSGAGAKPSIKTHFMSVHDNFSAYAMGHAHRHVPEMEQELTDYGKAAVHVTFTPHLLPVARGILSTIYVNLGEDWTASRVTELWRQAYDREPFLDVMPPDSPPSLAHVVRSNRVAFSAAESGIPGRIVIVSVLDNLVKGASGQAVQNANVMVGLDETAGLV
jgi:N-acetyl-gamma-glutamyl-phosphate reductase